MGPRQQAKQPHRRGSRSDAALPLSQNEVDRVGIGKRSIAVQWVASHGLDGFECGARTRVAFLSLLSGQESNLHRGDREFANPSSPSVNAACAQAAAGAETNALTTLRG